MTDHGLAAQHGSTGIDGDIVLDGGVAALAPQALTAPGGQRAQGHTLVNLYIVADNGGFTDNDACTVVNEEVLADSCAGVDVDTGDAVRMLGHNSRQHRYIQKIQFVSQTVDSDGIQTGVGENDLCHTGGGGVAVIGRLQIGLHHSPNLGDSPEEFQTNLLRVSLSGFFILAVVCKHQSHLAVQVEHHILNEHGEVVLCVVAAVVFILKVAGEYNSAELFNDVDDHILVRLTELFDLVDVPVALVITQNGIHYGFNFLFIGSHTKIPPFTISLYHRKGALVNVPIDKKSSKRV